MKRPLFAGLILGFVLVCFAAPVAFAQEVDPETGDLIEAPPEKEDPLKNMKLIASYALTVIGVVVIGMAVVKTFSSSLSYPTQRVMLTNFLRTNPYQLVVMEKKAKGTIAEPVIAALKIGGQMGPIDIKMIQQGTQPTYEATGKGMLAHFGATMTKCKLAVTAAGAGALVALTAGRYLPVVLGVLAGIGFLRIWMFKGELESQLIRGRAEILPEVEAAVAQGRFHTPIQIPGQ